ncbi:MAG: hypothetical protein AAF711_05095 [Planctomycetota bacterium]
MHHTCHDCGYDLTGLPPQGECPECGTRYDIHSIYRATQAHEPAFVKHVKWVALTAFTVMVLVCGGALSIQSDRPLGVVALTLIIAGVSGFGAFTYWWVMRQERQGAD